MRHRGGPPQPLSAWLPFGQGPIAAAADAISRARVRAGALPPAEVPAVSPTAPPEPKFTNFETSQPGTPAPAPSAAADNRPSNEVGKQEEAPEPRPNSPEDAGFVSFERRASPAHTPRLCSSCAQPIYWAQILVAVTDPRDGAPAWVRSKNEDTGRYKSMPVNHQPDPDGKVVLFHRPGEGIVCRVLKKGEAPPPGTKLRTSHFATCPNARQHRRSR
jgi:hypothetical protein